MIEVEGLSKDFDGRTILRDVSFHIDEGDVFALIGRSGSGKTVLMKHLIGLLVPDEGHIRIDGTDVIGLSREALRQVRRRFGVLFQGGALFNSMNVYENTSFPLRMFTDWPEARIERRVMECLEMVELPDVAHKYPVSLSGGQRKRVGLARAITLEPKYLFFDEPTSDLDPETTNTVDELILHLSRRLGTTSVIVTHDIHSVLNVADRVGFIHEGTMWFEGTVAEMRACQDPTLCRFVKASEYQI